MAEYAQLIYVPDQRVYCKFEDGGCPSPVIDPITIQVRDESVPLSLGKLVRLIPCGRGDLASTWIKARVSRVEQFDSIDQMLSFCFPTEITPEISDRQSVLDYVKKIAGQEIAEALENGKLPIAYWLEKEVENARITKEKKSTGSIRHL
ncbi:hypothetical protein FJY84_08240 [Candidatus Bathyarchaeota archaeon]|nr:hypothetical protein [Candidatus Bathyarchaeota archaeon]